MRPRPDPIGALAMHSRELLRAVRLYWHNRTPQAWRQAAFHVRLSLARRSPPVTITLAPTFRCPCRCVHCFAAVEERGTADELKLDEVKSILDQSREIGTMHVIFSGGEPLLRGDLAEMVAHAHRIGLLTRVSTSGILLTRERVAELKEAGLGQCGVSIDDPDPASHDRLRGVPGAYGRAMRGVGYLREAGILTKMLVCTARRNVTEGLDRLIAEARRRGMMGVYMLLPIAAGRWEGAYEEVLTEEETTRVRRLQDMTSVHMELATRRTNCCAQEGAATSRCRRGSKISRHARSNHSSVAPLTSTPKASSLRVWKACAGSGRDSVV